MHRYKTETYIEALNCEVVQIVIAAVEALAEREGEDVTQPLLKRLEALGISTGVVWRAFAERMGEDALVALIKALKDKPLSAGLSQKPLQDKWKV